MVYWYPDEGLSALEREWKREHPKAVVYKIADKFHSQNPDVSQHAPDRGGSKPGDDKGEVDADDFMPGNGVTEKHLADLAEGLRLSRDKRIMIVIWQDRIFSSVPVGKYKAFEWRPYKGKYHGHVHVSVNDNYDNDQSDWKWEKLVAKNWKYKEVTGANLPENLLYGDDDDNYDGWNHIARAQALLNFLDKKDPLDLDGAYGARTVEKAKKVFGGNGKVITFNNLKTLHGFN